MAVARQGRTTARSDEDENGHDRATGMWTPRPDPTKLTTEQLNREIGSLDKVITTRLDGMDRAILLFNENLTRVPTDTDKQVQGLKLLLEERLRGMDKATELLQTIFDQLPHLVDERIKALKDLHEEKINGLHTQISERDVNVQQAALEAKTGLAAALAAAEKAGDKQTETFTTSINKSENGTNNQLSLLTASIVTQSESFNGKIENVKETQAALETRVARAETVALNIVTTGTDTKTASHNNYALLLAGAALFFAALAALAAIGSFLVSYIRH